MDIACEKGQGLTQPPQSHSQDTIDFPVADQLRAPALSDAPSETKDDPKNCSKLATLRHGIVWFVKDQWFLLAMAMLIVIASQVQVSADRQHIKRTVVNYLSVSIIIFINGCTLQTNLLIESYKRWKLHAFVQLQCYLVASATAYAVVSLCAMNPHFMDPWLLIGFLFIGCAPTAIGSNVVLTRQAHGNTALTVAQSLIGQFLCPFLTPILLQMYLSSGAWYGKVLVDGDNYSEIYRRVFLQLGLSVFVPMVAGQVLQNLFPNAIRKVFFDWKIIKVSSFALLISIWQTFDQAFASGALQSLKPSNVAFTVCMCLGLFLAWLAITFLTAAAWLPRKDAISCCYLCPAKALTMIVPLSSVMYIDIQPIDQSKLQIPAIIFLGFQISIGGLFTALFRRWVRPAEEQEKQHEKTVSG